VAQKFVSYCAEAKAHEYFFVVDVGDLLLAVFAGC